MLKTLKNCCCRGTGLGACHRSSISCDNVRGNNGWHLLFVGGYGLQFIIAVCGLLWVVLGHFLL